MPKFEANDVLEASADHPASGIEDQVVVVAVAEQNYVVRDMFSDKETLWDIGSTEALWQKVPRPYWRVEKRPNGNLGIVNPEQYLYDSRFETRPEVAQGIADILNSLHGDNR